jgi:ADP-ribosylglycohydrolase
MKPTYEDRCIGTLLGAACGDALGAPVEFLSGAATSSLAWTRRLLVRAAQ